MTRPISTDEPNSGREDRVASCPPIDFLRTPTGVPVWSAGGDGVEIRFVGRASKRLTRLDAFAAIEPRSMPVAWLRQVHGDRCVDARPGDCGDGDAIVSRVDDLALSIVTADCVPVVVASEGGLAAAHAGWRGIVSGVVGSALDGLDGPSRAWIGPAIGPCCYEVGDEVAAAVEAATGVQPSLSPAGRPHLDLVGSVVAQLRAGGVEQVVTSPACTRCHSDLLWSYRRDGSNAGRNFCFAWRHRWS